MVGHLDLDTGNTEKWVDVQGIGMPFHFFLNPIEEISQRGRKKWWMSISGPEPSHLPTGFHGPVGPKHPFHSVRAQICEPLNAQCSVNKSQQNANTWTYGQLSIYCLLHSHGDLNRPRIITGPEISFLPLLHCMLVWFKGWKLWIVEMPSLSFHLSKPNEKKTSPQYIATGIKISTQKKKKKQGSR